MPKSILIDPVVGMKSKTVTGTSDLAGADGAGLGSCSPRRLGRPGLHSQAHRHPNDGIMALGPVTDGWQLLCWTPRWQLVVALRNLRMQCRNSFGLGAPGAVSRERYRDLVAAATATTGSVRLKVRVVPHTDA